MSNRDKHHILGAKRFKKDNSTLPQDMRMFSRSHEDEIYNSIIGHRSSLEWEQKDRLQQMMTKIDTGYPFNVERFIERSIKYAIKNKPEGRDLDEDYLYEHVTIHTEEKYLEGGYARKELSKKECDMLDHLGTTQGKKMIRDRVKKHIY
ncbi:MAG: hypothetical protein ACRCX2_18025 [Paraclostridium sp.]